MKIFTKLFSAALAAAILLTPGKASAKVLINENFEYAAGALVGNGRWFQYSTGSTEPITVGGTALTYAGYQDEAKGLAAVMAPGEGSTAQKARIAFDSFDDRILSGSAYMSFLLNVTSAKDAVYIVTFYSASATNFDKDKTGGSDIGRMFIQAGANNTFNLGVNKNSSSNTVFVKNGSDNAEFEYGKTYLVVMKYEIVDETKNDIVSLWVNPQISGTEPAAQAVAPIAQADISATNGVNGVLLRQAGTATKVGPAYTVDALRLATSWAELFGESGGGGETPQPEPTDATITTDVTSLDLGATIQGTPVSKTFVVKGDNITEDITVSSSSSDFAVSPTTIAAADAMSAEGVTVTVTMKATSGGDKSGKITLSTKGAESVSVALTGSVTAIESISSSTFITNNEGDGSTLYRYVGLGATITYIDATSKRFYAQDVVGGICFDYSALDDARFAVNDKLKNVLGYIAKDITGANIYTILSTDYTLTHNATPKEALEVSASEVALNPESYIFRLITLEDAVKFDQSGEGVTFAAKSQTGVSGSTNVSVMPFASTDLIGTSVPAAATVTGISYSMKGVTLRPRNAEDVVAQASATLEASVTKEFDQDFGEVGTEYQFATLTVTSKGLEAPATVYLSGKGAAAYSIDVTTIPAGDATTTVNVKFKPESVGKFDAYLGIEAVPTTLNKGFALTAMALDSENAPAIIATPTALEDFTATVGATQDKTLQVTVANAPYYGTAKLTGNSGAFRLSTGMLDYASATEITVSFVPNAAGTYTDAIVLSAPGAQDVTITLKGTATGSTPTPDKEGDDLVLDTTSPLTYMVETFDDAVKNKPLKINGWVNNAVAGNRAWWGYTFADDNDNKVAKVTGYDFFATDDTEAHMLLATPALDYIKTDKDNRFLTFRVKGQNLSDEIAVTPLDVVLLEPVGENVMAYNLGIDIPAGASYNDNWQEFIVDLDDLDFPDVFFIGFDFNGTRSKNSSVVWYLDDVTWGRSDIAFIRPVTKIDTYTCNACENHVATYTVNGIRLTGDISLKMVGSHASNFSLSTTTLPSTGGNVTVTFFSDQKETEHIAYVELSSEGAPKSYIEIHATTNNTESIDDISGSTVRSMNAYTADGIKVASDNAGIIDTDKLAPGLYIIVTQYTDGTSSTRKVIVR